MDRLFDNSDLTRFRHCPTLFVRAATSSAPDSEASEYRRSQYALLKEQLLALLGDGEDCAADTPEQSFAKFRAAAERGVKAFNNVTFVDGSFCASVDAVRDRGEGLEFFYTKTTPKATDSAVAKAAYIDAVASKSGYPPISISVAVCNRSYVRRGAIVPDKLFKLVDLKPRVEEARRVVEDFFANAERLVKEPITCDMAVKCERPDKCEYYAECAAVPRPCMLDFHGIDGPTTYKLFASGCKSLDDLLDNAHLLKPAQAAMVRMYLTDDKLHIDEQRVRAFLEKLHYPMCFLDFEACQPALPLYNGTRPFMQIPFQYSLHVKRTQYSELEHYQYLPKRGEDPRPEIARRLSNQIPHAASVVVFSKGLECKVLGTLATRYRTFGHKLSLVRNGIADLQELFASRAIYSRAMLGSTSLKAVYPALFPGDKSCDYSILDVRNGAEAMRLFTRAQYADAEECERFYQYLYTYCGKDTLSLARMVTMLFAVTGAQVGQRKSHRKRKKKVEQKEEETV